ncbi:MAG TPA: hypothetical protein VGE04_18055 [Chloroflexia bacterium]
MDATLTRLELPFDTKTATVTRIDRAEVLKAFVLRAGQKNFDLISSLPNQQMALFDFPVRLATQVGTAQVEATSRFMEVFVPTVPDLISSYGAAMERVLESLVNRTELVKTKLASPTLTSAPRMIDTKLGQTSRVLPYEQLVARLPDNGELKEVIHDLYRLLSRDVNAESGAVPVTQHAFATILTLLIGVSGTVVPFPYADVTADEDDGSIALYWEHGQRRVHLMAPARQDQQAYIFHRELMQHGLERPIAIGRLEFWLRWLIEA